MPSNVIKQEPGDLGGDLISSVMLDPRQEREAVVRRDELGSTLGCHLADRVSESPQMNRVGTLVGPTGRASPRARYQASAASIADALPITERCLSIAAAGTPFRAKRPKGC